MEFEGEEAAINVAASYLEKMDSGGLVKLDFNSAFNSLRHDRKLEAVKQYKPDIFPLVHSAILHSPPSVGPLFSVLPFMSCGPV